MRNSNPNLTFLVDLAQKDAGHHEARDEQDQDLHEYAELEQGCAAARLQATQLRVAVL